MNELKSTALLLDLLPYEIPLIYSNVGLYNYINNLSTWNDIFIDDNKLKIDDTQPFNFYIFKNDLSNRLINLLHPLAQLQILKFIERFDQEIINYFNTNAIYSLRYPNKVNTYKKKHINKIESEMNFMLNEEFEVNNNDYEKYMDSYFSKYRFKKITDFYKSNMFRKLETKYSFLQKLDISNCFYSIYTHSIDWAYLGNKEYAKENKNGKRLSTKLDRIMSSSNYGETNGIVVGPEFSRIVAEIVLTRIDRLVFEKIQKCEIRYKKDYEVVRYIDDIFIFTNDIKNAEIIKNTFIEYCNEFKLSINESKAFLETNPFLKKHIWVSKLKKVLKDYFDFFEKVEFLERNDIFRFTNSFITEIRALIIEFEFDKHSIVSFVLTTLERKWQKIISKTIASLKIENNKSYVLYKFVELIHYILSFSITTQNVIKYTKLIVFINMEATRINDSSIKDLIFKKTLEIINYHNNRSTEILNLLILLKHFEKEVPEKILLEILNKDSNYFTMAAITYYLHEGNRLFRYKKVKVFINEEIIKINQGLVEKFIFSGTDKNKIKKLLSTKDFYIIHDFYSSKILTKKTKKEIDKIKIKINNENWNKKEESIFNVFVEYIKDFDKPFMNWNTTSFEFTKILVEKTIGIEAGTY